MLLNHVHRLWVVPSGGEERGRDQSQVLWEGLGVLSLTDILRAVYISEMEE
jgi:hypothetical protein